MKPALTHLALHVADIEASIAFYAKMCGLTAVHDRTDEASGVRVVWMAEEGKEDRFVFVLISGGAHPAQSETDMSHLGFAVESREEVDRIAQEARRMGVLVWEPQQHPYPVGYFCAARDPDGTFVEFSYGQPLGPGADEAKLAHESAADTAGH